VSEDKVKLTPWQQRVLKLLFKFRFISTQLLADIMVINRKSAYQVLESLVSNGLVDKVYETDFRYAKKPAYYYLSKKGVTAVRKLLDVKETVVHTLYNNPKAPEDFISHCLTVAACYVVTVRLSSPEANILTKTEINKLTQFPKNRPDLYIKTPDGKEAIVVVADNQPKYITQKRLDEIIDHSEDEGWPNGDYPHICFILKDDHAVHSFLYITNKKLEDIGFDEDEIHILATSLKAIKEGSSGRVWFNAFNPKKAVSLFE
jgi:DNA-binding PadR family transcriptional regulator